MSVLTAFRHLIATGTARPSTTAAPVPQPSPSVASLTGGGRISNRFRWFRAAVMSPVPVRGVPVPEHGGSDDLDRWPASAAEIVLAEEWLRHGDPLTAAALYQLTVTPERAVAIGETTYERRRAREADLLLARAFGLDLE